MSINPPRRRSAAYRIPGVCALALLGGAGIWAAHRSVHEFTATSLITLSPRALLSLQTGSADLVVSRGSGSGIRIERRTRWIGERPTHSVREGDGGQLVLDDSCPGGIIVPAAIFSFHDDCSTTYRVQVPAGQAIRLVGGSGDIELRDLGGRVTAIAGSGDVSLHVPGNDYRIMVSTGSGDDSLEGLVSKPSSKRAITARTGSGDVSIDRTDR